MRDETIIILGLAGLIALIEIVALIYGYDGQLLLTVVGIIGGLAGLGAGYHIDKNDNLFRSKVLKRR